MTELRSLVNVFDFANEARRRLPKSTDDFFRNGSEDEKTLKENREAFQRFYINPRMLIDVSRCDLTTSILGHRVQIPFGVAPTGYHVLGHPDGEKGTAKAAAHMGAVFTLSTISTTRMEDVALEGGLRFFQLYVYKDRTVSKKLVQRAEKSGFKGIVLTVDVPTLGTRYSELRNKFTPPNHLLTEIDEHDEKATPVMDIFQRVSSLNDSSLTWKDIEWLQSITSLPIILKGILTGEDALKGLNAGCSAIWVSNHGGRQLDGVQSSIEALPEIVAAVGRRCEVYVDGGFRTGSDIFKGLALGANMVFLGRPLVWGLACGGSEGAQRVLKLLKNELYSVMSLSGFPSVRDICSDAVRRRVSSKL